MSAACVHRASQPGKPDHSQGRSGNGRNTALFLGQPLADRNLGYGLQQEIAAGIAEMGRPHGTN